MLVRRGAFDAHTPRFDQHMLSTLSHPLSPAHLHRAAALPSALPSGMYSAQRFYTFEPLLFGLQRWQASSSSAIPAGLDNAPASGAAAQCTLHMLSYLSI